MEEYKILVEEEQSGQRIDALLASCLEGLSRSYLQKLIHAKNIQVNKRPVKASCRLAAGDRILVCIPDPVTPDIVPEPIPLDILYEDNDLIFVNKPKGMVVHPAPGHMSGTLVNALLAHCGHDLSGINGVLRPGIVHRIDMETTGVIVACKNDEAHNAVAAQLAEHSITRKYFAIVNGVIREDDGTIDIPIGRSRTNRLRMAPDPEHGKRAVTHYHVLERYRKYTYLECQLETGRTHQIRVHMTQIHHPLLGDTLYGNIPHPYHLQGQTLHAGVLGLIHPRTGQYLEVSAPLPDYFQHLLEIMDR